jgi:O-antigen/teichoic acid export membrane protein
VDGILRGLPLDAGAWTVRFRYSPDSVKIGAFISFLTGMVLLFLLGIYLWRFFYREEDDASTVRRVAKNSIAPIVINLFTRSIEMASAALMARILGAVGNGRYATAISIYLWFDIIANFGLDMVLMREVARDRGRGRNLLTSTMLLRGLLFVGTAVLMAAFLTGRQALAEPLASETIWAVVLLYVGLLPFSMANGLAALFRGCERHEIPAAIQTVTTIVKVTLQVLVLVGGVGIIGLAATSIVTNIVTLVVLAVLARRMIWPLLLAAEGERPALAGWTDWHGQRMMLAESWPLMASLLLQQLFPGVNILLLQALQGDAAVGWYDAARKWVDAPSIVPSFFTFAVFPVMSRQAAEDRSGLQRSYSLSVKLLTMLTLPVALCITFLARPLVGLLSGEQFLPEGADILRLLVWAIVFGWLNSLTNYVLIALHRQRFVLLASGARVGFTIVANLLFVRSFGYMASAWIIIAGELLLAILFLVDLRQQTGIIGLLEAVVRPFGAGLAMAVVAWALSGVSIVLALFMALATYITALVVLRALSPDEWRLLAPLLPLRLRKLAPS